MSVKRERLGTQAGGAITRPTNLLDALSSRREIFFRSIAGEARASYF